MDAFRLIALCVLALLPVALLKKKTPEQALLLTLAVLAVAAARCAAMAAPLVERLQQLVEQAGLEESHVSVLLRTVAASLVTKLGSDLCRDGGSQALAGAVEMAGAAAAVVIALPLLESVVGLLLGYFG